MAKNSTPNEFGMFSESVLYSTGNVRRTRSLFKELSLGGQEPVFTLGRDRGEGYICLKKLYIQFCVSDPSEAIFAEVVFGDIGFWKNIAKCTWMQDHLEEWREVVEVKRKSLAFQSVIKQVEEDGKSSFQAARFLIEEPWKDKRTPKVAKAAKASTTQASNVVSSDVKRLKEEGLLN